MEYIANNWVFFSEKSKLHKTKMAGDGVSPTGSNVRWQRQSVQDGGSSGIDPGLRDDG